MGITGASNGAPVLRRAHGDDVERIHELVRAAYEGYVDVIGRTPIPMLTDYAAAIHERHVYVLAAGDSLAGVLDVDSRPDHLWLENVAVHPEQQRRGLGRLLLGHAEDLARQQGLPEIRLLTNERYLDNIAMYVRHGYRETHRRSHLGTDLVYFSKPIDIDRRDS